MNARVLTYLCLGASLVAAEGWSWPKVVMIGVEQVRPGKEMAHQQNEHTWALTLAGAKSPFHFLGMTPAVGGSQAWWVWPMGSFKDLDAFRAFPGKVPDLQAKIDAIAAKDGEFITDYQLSAFILRPDLSKSPGTIAARFYWIFNVHLKPGHEADFEGMAKQMNSTYEKAGLQAHWGIYQSMAAAKSPTFMVVMPLHALADLDAMMADDAKFAAAAGEDGLKAISKLEADGAATEESLILAVDPKMSYPDAEDVAMDPEFWKGWDKAPAPKPKEK